MLLDELEELRRLDPFSLLGQQPEEPSFPSLQRRDLQRSPAGPGLTCAKVELALFEYCSEVMRFEGNE